MIAFLSWWWIAVPSKIVYIGKRMLVKLYDFFSISLLLKTLLLPWKRDEINATNVSLDVVIRIWIMNMVSVLVGFTVRGMTIFIGFVVLFLTCLITVFVLIGFYLLPFLSIAMLILAIRSFNGFF
ncbi:MAG: hypothetical protein BWY43_00539 [candidate division WS2 bacterium ADurb.Bin280]|uniref:Uncharacterized protein n=1 Tax=candidate division WS2 bacterium ADurb.Bin280 TaxID=1852829 RepID=A0A1V5SCZ9_9BACT|nr:MAG: hypothetical protein BWY43_00539 [candidate division WS2 bacterium ADurb.Bin280]